MKHPPYTYSSFIKGRRFVLLRVREILNTDAGKEPRKLSGINRTSTSPICSRGKLK